MAQVYRILVGLLVGFTLILSTLGAWFWILADYEDEVFRTIAKGALKESPGVEAPVLALLHAAHRAVAPGHAVFRAKPYVNLTDSLLRTPLNDLIDGRGGCGSYATVLARLLQVSDYEFRIVQMHCGNQRGCHILVEAKTPTGWVALDAMYDLAFRTPAGALASMPEIAYDWGNYRKQAPTSFPADWFTFEKYSYTNWEKVPYLMPLGEKALRFFLGDTVDTLSLRAYVINRGRVMAGILLSAAAFSLLLAVWIFRKHRK